MAEKEFPGVYAGDGIRSDVRGHVVKLYVPAMHDGAESGDECLIAASFLTVANVVGQIIRDHPDMASKFREAIDWGISKSS